MMETGKQDSRLVGGHERRIGSALVSVVLIGALGACEIGTIFSDDGSPDSFGYPSLRSVPFEPRPSSSIEKRREIVRSLLDEREKSRRQSTVVRQRSGLSVDPPEELEENDPRAEDIVPDQSEESDVFRLKPGKAEDTREVYRTESQVDDGGLDDFIRELQRDTSPPEPLDVEVEPEDPASYSPSEDDVSALTPSIQTLPLMRQEGGQPILLAAFAPALAKTALTERDVMIRLAADEEEPGVYCRYFGWTLAWSNMCVEDAGAEPLNETEPPDERAGENEGDNEENVGADLEPEFQPPPEEDDAGGSGSVEPGASSPSGAGRERAEKSLSESDAAEAIEDAGRSALAPVTSSLRKLRDFMNAGPSDDAATPSFEQVRPSRSGTPSARTAAIDRPPTPERRPKRREDLVIEDKGETFTFDRTPLPAFKPTPDEPVILQARNDDRSTSDRSTRKPIERVDPPPQPLLKPDGLQVQPSDLLSELKGDGGEGFERDAGASPENPEVALALTTGAVRQPETVGRDEPEALSTSPTVVPSDTGQEVGVPPDTSQEAGVKTPSSTFEPSEPLTEPASEPALAAIGSAIPQPSAPERASLSIAFEPGTRGLPKDHWRDLAALLDDARATDQKIHIIGEAGSNHIAKRRATDVGAALVQLGATVEILEYDHDAIAGVDQVRLVLRPALDDPLTRTREPAVIEK